ncbi:P63C domain-containing protein [Spirosoma daeguense]
MYRKKYPDEYYRQMAHVLGLPVTEEKMHRKPPIMARITNDIIYDRFGKGFVKEVQTRNPMSKDGERPLYHHQLLTDDADQKLTQFLKEAISVMGECVGMGRFRLIQCLRKKCGRSWQMDAFMD